MEKEALAIVHAVTVFYPYLWGRKFTVVTDHNPPKWLIIMAKPIGLAILPFKRLMRWSLILIEFDMEIQYRPGSKHGNADEIGRIYALFSAPIKENTYIQISFIVSEWH